MANNRTKIDKEKQLQKKLLNSPIFKQIAFNAAPYDSIFNIINQIYKLKNKLELGDWHTLASIEELLNEYTFSLENITKVHNIDLGEAVKLYHIINLLYDKKISNTFDRIELFVREY